MYIPFISIVQSSFHFVLGSGLSRCVSYLSACSLKPLQALLCLFPLSSSSSSRLITDPVTHLCTWSTQCSTVIKPKAPRINQPQLQLLYLSSFCLNSHIFKILMASASKVCCEDDWNETWNVLSTMPGMQGVLIMWELLLKYANYVYHKLSV